MNTKMKVLATSIALIIPTFAHAETNADLKAEIEAMKTRLQQLEATLAAQKTAPAPASTIDPEEFNRMKVKVEAMEDSQESSGFKGVKISGYVDPTFMYNHANHKSSTLFLNQNYSASPGDDINNLRTDTFSYYNSYFGGFSMKFEKEFEGGMKTMATLHPRRSVSNTYDFGNLFEEAMIWVPLSGDTWKVAAGQAVTYNGYDYIQSNMKKTITSNLLNDFAGPGFMTGAGLEYKSGKWWVRSMAGNINTSHDTGASGNNQGVHWRVDYAKGEFTGWGVSGLHGDVYDKRYNYLETDAYFIRGPLTLQGQVEGSNWKNGGFNGGNTGHVGFSTLLAYKFEPRVEGIVRFDYLDNHRNGGGLPTLNLNNSDNPTACSTLDANGTATCGDYRNGFGPGAVWDGSAWVLGNPNRGARRSALTLGLNYQFHTNAVLKFEVRNDFSNLYSFQYSNGTFHKRNTVIGTQAVVSF